MAEDPVLTDKQRRELQTTVRHLGRAMASMDRAALPDPPRHYTPAWYDNPTWLLALYHADEALRAASNKLIAGLEAMDRG
jgi:Ser/Thr protein kinase RdoA (MazF antagonist)